MATTGRDLRQFKTWVLQKGYEDVLPVLATSISNLDSRVELLERDLRTARKLLQEFQVEEAKALIEAGRQQNLGRDPELHRLAKDIYYSALDCISRLLVLTEILLVYYGSLRRGVGHLPRLLTERRPVRFDTEISRIGRLKLNEIYTDFRFPDVSGYSCESGEKAFLRRILSRTAKLLRSCLKDLVSFRCRFVVVYNKYKHTLVEDTSRIAVVERDQQLTCLLQLYVRSKELTPRTKRPRVYTYVIRVDESLLSYLDSVIDKFATIMVSLVNGHLQWLVNRGKPAFPQQVDVWEDERKELQRILDAEPSFIHVKEVRPEFHVRWKPSAAKRVESGIHRQHIVRLAADHMDPKGLRNFTLRKEG